jgi:hypothetical protein
MASVSLLSMLASCCLALGACTISQNPPLIFGQTHTVGISVGSTVQQGPDITLGYRDVDIAVVPVTAVDVQGRVYQISSRVGKNDTNSLSVLGQFDIQAAAAPNVGLGKFFATGLAADKLADGFRAKMRK